MPAPTSSTFHRQDLTKVPSAPLKASIAIVDDDTDFHLVLIEALRTTGLEFECYDSGEALLSQYEWQRPGCILLDLRLPDRSGIDIQKALSVYPLARPIVFITGYGDVPTSVEVMRAGAQAVIEKPFQAQHLLDIVQACIRLDARNRARLAIQQNVLERLEALTPREREVFDHVVRGLSNKEIARLLDTSFRTVEVQRMGMMRKMKVASVAELVRLAFVANIDASAVTPD